MFRLYYKNPSLLLYVEPVSAQEIIINSPYRKNKFRSKLHIYRVSQEECAKLREGVPYGKIYRYNPKYLCPKLNGYGDNGQRILKL